MVSFDDLYKFVTTLVLIVETYLLVRRAKPDTQATISAAVKNLADALNLSSTELTENIAEAAKLRDTIEKERKETTKRRAAADKKISELEEHLNTIEKQYQAEAQQLRSENTTLKRQFIELDDKYKVIDQKYTNSKSALIKMVKALEDAGVLLPDLNGDLSDSVKILAIDMKKKK